MEHLIGACPGLLGEAGSAAWQPMSYSDVDEPRGDEPRGSFLIGDPACAS